MKSDQKVNAEESQRINPFIQELLEVEAKTEGKRNLISLGGLLKTPQGVITPIHYAKILKTPLSKEQQ